MAITKPKLDSTQPSTEQIDITPSDVTALSPPVRGFLPGSNGNLHYLDGNGVEHTVAVFAGVLYGGWILSKVFSTGTTCTPVTGFY